MPVPKVSGKVLRPFTPSFHLRAPTSISSCPCNDMSIPGMGGKTACAWHEERTSCARLLPRAAVPLPVCGPGTHTHLAGGKKAFLLSLWLSCLLHLFPAKAQIRMNLDFCFTSKRMHRPRRCSFLNSGGRGPSSQTLPQALACTCAEKKRGQRTPRCGVGQQGPVGIISALDNVAVYSQGAVLIVPLTCLTVPNLRLLNI